MVIHCIIYDYKLNRRFCMDEKWGRIFVIILLVVSFFTAGNAFAGANDLAKQAGKIIRNAERKMHSGKVGVGRVELAVVILFNFIKQL